ncbi:hypothetical protein B0I32_103235 [Nonomuraea fuscirosea]|uniref:Excreted virulence factor EspC (Type VII ESX diderm) n=1 Tax=Nonomuraea fuscirosea TaxID=1291556 RepID=A0A2T0N6R3_9ACTN|nr:hypothetical protein [Nonomuraea fuscirosea]PRX68274.1 hypothetical protein B0I32_103235 [Nonomuraea fuscirosea]
MTALDIHFQALEDCAKTAREVAGQLQYTATKVESAGSGLLGGASIFGKLAGASGLASAVNDVETMVGDEFEAARDKIGAVAKALGAVEQNVRAANKANGAAA